jgi:hypothetical protein
MINFKKIAAVASGLLVAGLTLGTAAAATFPAPFVQGGVADVAIVYGTGAGVSPLDFTQAGNIQTKLGESMPSAGTTNTIQGENVELDRPSTLLHLGNGIGDVFGRSVTKNDMPTLLADGTYRDSGSTDHDYTQKIDVANLSLSQFDLSNYDSSVGSTTPVIGFPISSGDNILNYTLTFQDSVDPNDMNFTNLELMGTSYYVLSATTSKLTLLDSGSSASLGAGDTTTLTVGNQTYDVSVAYIDSTNVQLTINGVTTDSLVQGDTYKLADGTYVGIKKVLSQGYSGGISKVDFAIGAGKIEMDNGTTVQVNGNAIDGVTSTISNSGSKITNIAIQWAASDDTAVTKDTSLTMPTFDGVKLSFSGMNYPDTETTKVSNDGNTAVKISTTVQNGAVDLDILGMNKTDGNYTTVGKDSTHLLQTSSANYLNFDAHGTNSSAVFVVSWNSTKDAESYVYKVNNFLNDSGTIKANLISQDGGSTITMSNGTAFNVGVGNIVLTPDINYSAKTVNFTTSVSGVSFDTLYTKDGLKVLLPVNGENTGGVTNGLIYDNGTAGQLLHTSTTYPIQFFEESKDGTLAGGSAFNITVGTSGTSGSYETSVTDIAGAGNGIETGDSTNVYEYNVLSELATTIAQDEGPTQETATVTYHGGESYGIAYLTSPDAVITSGGASALGNVIVKDSEVSSVSDKNLIVVGGSCINSVAAHLLGGAYCGTDFTANTNVGANQFLIQSFGDAYATGKIALLVAGYETADTVNAATYLDTNKPVIDAGKKYVGTSATSAQLVVN